jgi:hypothetical protein
MVEEDIQRSLGRIEGQLVEMNKHLSSHFEEDKVRFAGYSGRIKSLEMTRAWLWGSVLTAKALIIGLFYFVTKGS